MAISPPGDIVLSVARAADPAKAAAARARLQAHAAAGKDFSATVDATATQAARAAGTARPDTETRFEAMVLQNFLQSLLPEETSSVYGEGLAGDMWRSMMAQQLSETLAEQGGLGIARRVLSDHTLENDKKVPIGAISSTPEQQEAGKRALLSSALVNEIERQAARTLGIGVGSVHKDEKS
ncbi:rod-binding protein [Nitratireductor sp. ZSWI3]|uniref:rod-binding protein n=1 Tax=Nitratireductor sp. ZSWI3 TaxID=2966359 RepID=UPI002150333E|nr:rod-binding protein [Nitratireductor sp. ZSWI3]MCR4264814.1 rod-binding protein [Nitratireductor sp. ZSWI3]